MQLQVEGSILLEHSRKTMLRQSNDEAAHADLSANIEELGDNSFYQVAITPDIAQLFPSRLLLHCSIGCADLWQLGKKNHNRVGEKNSCYDQVRHPHGADHGGAVRSHLCGRHGRQL